MSTKKFKKLSVVKLSANFSEAVQMVESELVEPKDNEVVLKVMFAGVNATDILISTGRTGAQDVHSKPPFDIGIDALGVIQGVGKDVTELRVGQSAFVFTYPTRAYAEYLYAKQEEVVSVPELKPEFVALRSGLTAAIGLDQAGRLKKDDKVLITAASGGTGHIAVQWAKHKGCYVIGMTSSSVKSKVLKELGCDRVLNYKREDINEVLRTEYPTGIDVIWETIGGRICETLFKHLAPKGRFIIVGGISGYKTVGFPQISLPINPNKLLIRNQCLTGFTLEGYQDLYKKYFKELIQSIVDKKLNIILDLGQNDTKGQFEGIESVVRAVEHLNRGENCGKVVIKIHKN